MEGKAKVTVIGGGTGTVSVLQGLKNLKKVELSVIVSMMDDGGSNRVIRDEFGILPLSDVRKTVVALSEPDKNQILRKLFTHRFSKGIGLSNHTFGNLIMTALTEIKGSEVDAIDEICRLFNINANVIPVTLDDVRLVAEYSDGKKVIGEHYIDEPEKISSKKKISSVFLFPEAEVYKKAEEAIIEADYIIIGPGDLYTSLLPNLLVEGVKESIKKSSGKIIYIVNLMSKIGQTNWMKISDFVKELNNYSSREADYILINNGDISQLALKRYKSRGEKIMKDDLQERYRDSKVIRADLVNNEIVKSSKNDPLTRSLIRHDSDKLKNVLLDIFNWSA